jgi:hypothetical protein
MRGLLGPQQNVPGNAQILIRGNPIGVARPGVHPRLSSKSSTKSGPVRFLHGTAGLCRAGSPLHSAAGGVLLLCCTAKIRPNVRFSPKATELPRGSEITRWAKKRHSLAGHLCALYPGLNAALRVAS